MNAIIIRDLTKKYGNIVSVNHLNLTVEQGELFALLGVNGAGKSTTIKLLSCLIQPMSGDALLLGNSIISNSQAVKKNNQYLTTGNSGSCQFICFRKFGAYCRSIWTRP